MNNPTPDAMVDKAVDRMIRVIPMYAQRDWTHNPIQETEREWMRPLALAALTPPAGDTKTPAELDAGGRRSETAGRAQLHERSGGWCSDHTLRQPCDQYREGVEAAAKVAKDHVDKCLRRIGGTGVTDARAVLAAILALLTPASGEGKA